MNYQCTYYETDIDAFKAILNGIVIQRIENKLICDLLTVLSPSQLLAHFKLAKPILAEDNFSANGFQIQ